MKNLKLLGLLMLMASSFMFIQCTSDPLAGPAGADGTNGIDGINGVDGSAAVCISCHSNDDRDAIKAEYAFSVHGIETTMYDGRKLSQYGNRANCAACHTNQGFIDRFNEQDMNLVGPYSTTSDQSITCTGCHSTHRSFDFINDGNDYALRTIDPVTLIIDPTLTFDATNASDLLGRSNTCVNCHQPRTPAPVIADAVSGKLMITSPYWGPHHGPQGTFLEGIGYAAIPGANGYPAPGTFEHKTEASCIKCHMSKGTAANNGGHTWNPTRNACASCHPDSEFPDATSFDRLGFQTETLAVLAEIQDQLKLVIGQDIAKDANGVYQPVFDINGVPVTHVGIYDVNGKLVLGLYDFVTVQAAWNFILTNEDRSEGVHNAALVDAMLPNTLDAITAYVAAQ